MSAWYETEPLLVSKNDLVGKKLLVLADVKPTATAKSGIFELKVFDPTSGETYFTTVTRRDLNIIVQLARKNQPFTFQLKADEKYAEVKPYEQ